MATANRLWEYTCMYMSRTRSELARSAIAFQYQPKLYTNTVRSQKCMHLHVYTPRPSRYRARSYCKYTYLSCYNMAIVKKKKEIHRKFSGHGRYSSYATVSTKHVPFAAIDSHQWVWRNIGMYLVPSLCAYYL